MLSVIAHWPATHSFSLISLGGYERLLDVLELAASENLSTNARNSSTSSSSAEDMQAAASTSAGAKGMGGGDFTRRMGSITSMKMLGFKLQELLGEELSDQKISSTTATASSTSTSRKGKEKVTDDEVELSLAIDSFAYKICQECLRHLKESAALGVHWASAFILTDGGVETKEGEHGGDVKDSSRGDGGGVALQLNTQVETKKKPNVLLGSWLLDLLLEHPQCKFYVKKFFFVDIYDALLHYISTKTTPSKGRLFPLLTRLLKGFGGFPKDRKMDAPEWQTLDTQMRALYTKEKGTSALNSFCLQRLIELMIVRRKFILEEQEKEKKAKEEQEKHEKQEQEKEKGKGKEKEDVVTPEEKWEPELEPMEGDEEIGTKDWFDGMISTGEVMQFFSKRDKLPQSFMCRAWLETQFPFVVIESSHPYVTSSPSSLWCSSVLDLLTCLD